MITMYGMSVNENRVVAEFGTDDICITPMQGENGEHILGFINQTPREIGSVGDYVKGDVVDCNDFPILFEFEKLESIDALIRALEDVKKQFTANLKPLTLKELQSVDGETVCVPESESWLGGTGVVNLEDGCVWADDGGFWPLDEYGATWFAYNHPLES